MVDDPFGDLADLEGESEEDEGGGGEGDVDESNDREPERDAPRRDGGDATTRAPDIESPAPNIEAETESVPDDPAFDYDQVDQSPLYARSESWEAFEIALNKAELELRQEHDVHDPTKRELHDAALHALSEMGSEIADAVVESRRSTEEH